MSDPSSMAPAEATETKSPLWLLLRVIDEPGAVFAALATQPRVLAPIVAVLAVFFVVGFVTPAEQMRERARQQAEFVEQRAERAPAEQAEVMRSRAADMVANAASTRARVMVAVLGGLGSLVSLAIVALVLMLVFGAMGSEPIRFKTEFAAAAHAYVPQLLGALVVVALGMMGMANVTLSLGFLSDMESSPFLFVFLSQFGVFAVWNVVLLAVANQTLIGGRSLTGPLAVVGGLWIVKNLLFAGLAALFAGMAG